jgi:hypothetical protein
MTTFVLTNGQTLILILFGIGVLTLIDFTLFYVYNKACEMYSEKEEEAPIGARIRTLQRKLISSNLNYPNTR